MPEIDTSGCRRVAAGTDAIPHRMTLGRVSVGTTQHGQPPERLSCKVDKFQGCSPDLMEHVVTVAVTHVNSKVTVAVTFFQGNKKPRGNGALSLDRSAELLAHHAPYGIDDHLSHVVRDAFHQIIQADPVLTGGRGREPELRRFHTHLGRDNVHFLVVELMRMPFKTVIALALYIERNCKIDSLGSHELAPFPDVQGAGSSATCNHNWHYTVIPNKKGNGCRHIAY
jgi:hypothetical protein